MATKSVSHERVLERLAALPDQASLETFLARHPRLCSPLFVARLDEAVSVRVRVDLKKADRLADVAMTIANQLGDKDTKAFAVRAKANALWSLGQNRQASELHAQAVHLFEEAGKPVEAARTLSISIQPLILLGEYERALAAADRARKIFTAAEETLRLARLDINVGNIFHRQDRFREALDFYESAFSQLLDKDTEGMIASLHNAAVCRIMLNEYERAENTYEQVYKLCRDKNLPLAMAQAEYNIAYLYYLRGAYGVAIEKLRTARNTAQAAGDPYHSALCQLDLSEIYLELNINQDAAELSREAFTSFKRLGMGYETAKALCNSAIALSQQGEGFRALELFAEARDMFVKEKNQAWPSLIDLYRAVVYFNEGRLPESRRYCLAALEYFSTSPIPGRAILCHLLLARLSLKMGEIEKAREQSEIVLENLHDKEMPILAYQAHLVMGQVEEALHHPQEAQHHYRVSKEVLEALRGGVHGEELKISFVKNKLEVYENLIDLCLASGANRDAQAEAWAYMEQAKSRGLLELISYRMHKASADGPEESEVAHKIRELREQLNWYYHRIEVEQLGQVVSSDERLVSLRELARQREKELLRVLRDLPPADASAAGIQPAAPVSLDSVRAALGPNTTLLEYFRVQERILAAIVTEDGVEISTISLAPRIAQILRMLQFQFSKFRLGRDYLQEFQVPLLEATRSHLHELYAELLAPVLPRLKGGRLIVVPHELLHYVPFHALFDGERYLIDSFTVSYAPSASIYMQHRWKPPHKADSSLILGVPDRQAPSIYEELQAVAEILPRAKVFLGPRASEKVLREDGARSRLIHIATHGFFRQDNPMFSGIRLGDTFLTLYDLYHLKLPAELVTLSGCSTGLNVIAAGDELIGLVRGLLSAGAQSLLLTLWDVNDSSTADFMKAFYNRLFNRPDRALALREAMVEIRQRYPHPYYWAPFILVG